MTLIAEFTFQTPILRDALKGVPEMVLQTETLHTGEEHPSKIIFWAWGDNFQTFERGLNADSTIKEYKCLNEIGDRRLYRTVPSEVGEEAFTYPVLAEHDATVLSGIGDYDGWTIRARFPGRATLVAYREACQERDIPFHLQSLYPEEQLVGDGGIRNPHGLTTPQREVLQIALELEYFAVPRQSTLDEIADELDVSVQAVSTRLRRALQTLLRDTLNH